MSTAFSGVHIARIETGTVRSRYPRAVGRNARLGSHGSGGEQRVVQVTTGDGASGWGLATGPLDPVRALVGRPLDSLFDPGAGVLDPAAACLDFALHDLAGRLLGKPVYALLGGAGPTRSTCYDGAIYLDDLDDPAGVQVVLDNVARDHTLGYTAFKLKIGRGNRWMPREEGLRRDIEVTRAVRAAYPQARILVDANDGYDAAGFVRYLEAVADCDLFWVEEPFPETIADLAVLRECPALGRTLVADGEYEPDVPALLELAGQKLLDVLLMDMVSYGLTAWRAIMPRLREIGVRASPHAWGVPLKTLYAAQVAAGLGNVVTIEGVPGTMEGLDCSGYALHEGVLSVPDAPGFGIALQTPLTAI